MGSRVVGGDAGAKNDHEQLHGYVARFFAAHGQGAFPTVRQAARALRWRQQRVVDAVDGDPGARMFTSSYFTLPEPPLGEHFIEVCEA